MADILRVELEPEAECHNPACRARLEPPDPEHRYCPVCGEMQLLECELCPTRPGQLLRVAEDSACPRCGAVYVLCSECRRPVPVTSGEALTCPEGCKAPFRAARRGSCAPLGTAERTRAIEVSPTRSTEKLKTLWHLGEPVSPPVCHYGRVYFGTSRGTVRCIEEDSGEEVAGWKQTVVLAEDALRLREATLDASGRYLLVGQGDRLSALSLSDGEPCFELQTVDGATWAASGDRLLVCETVEQSARLRLFDMLALNRGSEGLLQEHTLPGRSEGRPCSWPAPAQDSFLVVNPAGDLLEVCLETNKEPGTLWANSGNTYVSAPAVVGEQAYLLAHDPARGGWIVRLGLGGGAVGQTRLSGITPAYVGLGAAGRHIYVFDGRRDFWELDLRAPTAAPRAIFHGVELTGDQALESFLVLTDPRSGGDWLVSVAGSSGRLLARMVHTTTQERPSIGPELPADLALAASDRRLFITDLATGEVFVHPIPLS